MIKILPNLLNSAQLSAINELLAQGEFESGEQTAGWHAKEVKCNQQWHASAELIQTLNQSLSKALVSNQEFTALAYPKYLAPFIVSESSKGGYYGLHVDDALLIAQGVSRSDLSCTIFLCEAHDYEGGELCFDYHGVALSYKLNAGDVIIYPSTTVHQVKPVTKGCRKVAVSWIESYVRDASQREILFDLDQSRHHVLDSLGKGEVFDKLAKTHANLLRRWAQT